MTTKAAIGYGSRFELETSPGSNVYVEVAECDDLTPPGAKVDMIEATNFDSPNAYKEFIAGMIDPGELKLSLNFVPGSASESAILAAQAARVAYGGRITFPAGQVWTFNVLILTYEPAVPTDKKMTATVTGKVSGSILRA